MLKKSLNILFLVLGISLLNVSAQTDQKIKTISKGVVNGSAISLPIPAYPAAARAVGASGAVNVQVLIDEIGNVVTATAVSGHPLLRQVSEQAAIKAKFKPIFLQGTAVRVTGMIIYNFVLDKGEKPEALEKEFPAEDSDVSDGFTVGYRGNVITNNAVNLVKPAYPSAAKALRASGQVEVKVVIDEEGNVVSAEAVSGHPLLRSTAVNAALLSKFKPMEINSEDSKVTGVIIYDFISPIEEKPDEDSSDVKRVN